MTKIFIFPHFGLNIHHTFLYFVTLKGYRVLKGLCNREIILAALLKQNSKINMTKNREIVIFKKKNSDMIFLPYTLTVRITL